MHWGALLATLWGHGRLLSRVVCDTTAQSTPSLANLFEALSTWEVVPYLVDSKKELRLQMRKLTSPSLYCMTWLTYSPL